MFDMLLLSPLLSSYHCTVITALGRESRHIDNGWIWVRGGDEQKKTDVGVGMGVVRKKGTTELFQMFTECLQHWGKLGFKLSHANRCRWRYVHASVCVLGCVWCDIVQLNAHINNGKKMETIGSSAYIWLAPEIYMWLLEESLCVGFSHC